jgi:hypothetical protein
MDIKVIEHLVAQGFRCRECGGTFSADEFYYGHDCEDLS